MADIEQLKKELEGIEQFLQDNPGSPMTASMLSRKTEISAQLTGAIAQGQDSQAVGQNGIGVKGSIGGDIVPCAGINR
jgi:hypothetical protein